MGKRGKQGRALGEAVMARECAEMLGRLRDGPLTEAKFRGGKSQAKVAAAAKLKEDGLIVSLGRVGRSEVFAALAPGQDRKGCVRALAVHEMRERVAERASKANRMKPIKIGDLEKDGRSKKLPSAVRAEQLTVLNEWAQKKRAFPFKVGNSRVFLFREDLEAALGLDHAPVAVAAPVTDAPPASAAPVEDDAVARRVREAYRALRAETGRRNLLVYDLHVRSGVALPELHAFLRREAFAHRANPVGGEPTAVTQEKRDAALVLGGERHLLVELLGVEG